MACPVCGDELVEGLRHWHTVCCQCGYEGSTLQPQATESRLDEEARETALEALRKSNFRRLHHWIVAWAKRGCLGPPNVRPTLLDVGCAHGWFVAQCASDFDAVGIEPDAAVARAAARHGVSARMGFFPDVVGQHEKFDVIVFNDVLEHIPDVHDTLAACAHHLNPGGLLVVNAPSRRGVIYRASKIIARLGLPYCFERMWQKGFPSPHVHYCDTRSILDLSGAHGFRLTARYRLPSVSTSGLYSRIRYSKDISAAKALFLTIVTGLASPALSLLPPDIQVWLFENHGKTVPGDEGTSAGIPRAAADAIVAGP